MALVGLPQVKNGWWWFRPDAACVDRLQIRAIAQVVRIEDGDVFWPSEYYSTASVWPVNEMTGSYAPITPPVEMRD